MRKLSTLAAVTAAAIMAVWFAYPPFREWPAVRWSRGMISTGLEAIGVPVPQSIAAVEQPRAPAPAAKSKRGGGGPVPVTSALAQSAEMPVVVSAPGTVEPYATGVVKPRVDGQIVEIAFKEGQLVKAGDVLFRLDDRLMLAQIRQAEANIARDRASLKDAQAILTRREKLVAQKIVTQEATDTQRAQVEALKASIAAGQAQLDAWRTQLDYLTIRAPIPGRTGTIAVEIGMNVRSADTTALVTINQTQPITVTFAVPQSELGALRKALRSGASAQVRVAGESRVETRGRVVFIDNQINKQTGTLLAKLEVPNEDEALWPGQSVEVDLTVENRPGYVSVPAVAVLPSQRGMLSWVIGPDGKVAPRIVELERVVADVAYLRGGLKAGERVVTDGQLRLAPGSRVVLRDGGRGTAPGERGPAAAGRTKELPVQARDEKDGAKREGVPAGTRPAGSGRT